MIASACSCRRSTTRGDAPLSGALQAGRPARRRLPDIERMLGQAGRRKSRYPASLSSEVHTQHPGARALVDLRSAASSSAIHWRSCASIARQSRVNASCAATIRPATWTPGVPALVRRRAAAPRQIEQRESRLEEIRAELATWQNQADALRERLALTRDKARVYFDLEHDLADLAALPGASDQLAHWRASWRGSTGKASRRCGPRWPRVKRRRINCTARSRRPNAASRARDAVKTLTEETLLALEREADQARRARATSCAWSRPRTRSTKPRKNTTAAASAAVGHGPAKCGALRRRLSDGRSPQPGPLARSQAGL